MSELTLFVGNLPYSAETADLESAFSEFEGVTETKVVKDFQTGRSRGFGFVSFDSKEKAEQALVMDGKEINGRPLRVNIARGKGKPRPRDDS